MGENWIEKCNGYLEQIRNALNLEEPDRLESVKSMHLALIAINNSVLGWLQYVNNPEVMTLFDSTELHEINIALNRFAKEFIENDIKVTRKGMEKGLREFNRQEEERQLFYI